MKEVHPHPEEARKDGRQSLTFGPSARLMTRVETVAAALEQSEGLHPVKPLAQPVLVDSNGER